MHLRDFLVAGRLKARDLSLEPRELFERIASNLFTSSVEEGKTTITVGSEGDSASFMVAARLSPADVISLAVDAVEWEKVSPTTVPRKIWRQRVTFGRATL